MNILMKLNKTNRTLLLHFEGEWDFWDEEDGVSEIGRMEVNNISKLANIRIGKSEGRSGGWKKPLLE